MRRLLLLLSAVLALVLVAPAAASAGTAGPKGGLEGASLNTFSNTVSITGWALDPGAKALPTFVQVTVDGVATGGWRTAAELRADINRTYGATGGHGFAIALTVPLGKHQICASARLRLSGSTTSLGCFSAEGYRMATKADMLAIARTVDPKSTISWVWTTVANGAAGLALPWDRTVQIASGHSVKNLRAVVLHEWAHVLQYRAFAGTDPWWDAVQAFNSLLGHPGDRTDYDGVEHGADCIALALGADYLGYGCPAALKTYGALIARGVLMNKLQGTAAVTSTGRTATVTGWALDPASPTASTTVRVTDNGVAVTGWVRTTTVRADANRTTGVTGTHGFAVKVPLAKGTHRICVSGQFGSTGKAAANVGNCTTITAA